TFLPRKQKAANPVLKRSFSQYFEPIQLKSKPVDDITGKKSETEPTTSMEDTDSQAAQNHCVIPCRAETVQEHTPRCFKLRSWFRNIRHFFHWR
ncbi:hypothetical protein NDU88_004099, partial [Pleurodeles waltl]